MEPSFGYAARKVGCALVSCQDPMLAGITVKAVVSGSMEVSWSRSKMVGSSAGSVRFVIKSIGSIHHDADPGEKLSTVDIAAL